jgi:hypothetical protein
MQATLRPDSRNVGPVLDITLPSKAPPDVTFLKFRPPSATIAVIRTDGLTRLRVKESAMRAVRILPFACLAAACASAACAQYGLYGSPETLSTPQQQAMQPYAVAQQQAMQPYAVAQQQAMQPYAVAQQQAMQPYAVVQQQAVQPYAATSGYPSTNMPVAQPAPMYYPPQPQQPQYRPYPAQPAATTAYQPYQVGSQYRYPMAYARPQLRTASVEQPAAPTMAPAMAAAPAAPVPVAPAMPVAPAVVPTPQGASVMNQMLAEQGYGNCYGNCDYGGGVYRGAVNGYEQAACAPQAPGPVCDGYSGAGTCCPWYASASALVLNRSAARRIWTSYVDGSPEIQLTNNQVGMAWQWGGELRCGHRFCNCGTIYALEGVFWSTASMTGSETTSIASGGYPSTYVSTPLNTDNVFFYGPFGPQASAFFDHADSHTVARRDELYNVEINLLHDQLAWAADSPWDIGWSVGLRYFRFQESLTVSTTNSDVTIPPPYSIHLGPGDAYFKDNATNNMIGVQVGFDAAYNIGNGIRMFISPKVGIFDNILDSTFDAKARLNSQGANYVDGEVLFSGYSDFPAHGTTNGVAFLTQIDVGADWQFTRNWSLRAGYRLVAISGIGLADDQYPQFLCDTPDMGNPQHMSSLLLHGGFAGLTYNF